MNLNIVYIVHRGAALYSHGNPVARKNTEIGRMGKNSAYSAARKYGVIRINIFHFAACVVQSHYSETLVFVRNYIQHSRFANYFYIFGNFGKTHKPRSYFFARAILMKANSVSRVPAFARGGKRAVRISGKFHAERNKLVNHLRRRFNHTLHRSGVIFGMSRAHRVRVITFKIILALHTANSALRKVTVAFFRFSLTNK